jgi:predicted phosphodiesterase
MNLHVLSDTHFEFLKNEDRESFFQTLQRKIDKDQPELAVLAGDIATLKWWEAPMAQLCSMYKKVLYVPGNHEFFGVTHGIFATAMKRHLLGPDFANLVLLSDGPHVHGGKRFLGDTLWYPRYPDGSPEYEARTRMCDFYRIVNHEPDVYAKHEAFCEVLGGLKKGDVVVTHHLPLPQSIGAMYKDDASNAFFMADMSRFLVKGRKPSLWIHGHTHIGLDYKRSGMRVYCNPLGYPGEGTNSRFWNRLCVEV